jgi:hypothetical protein
MSMSFTGPRGWIEQRWIVYARRRDNVQHHLEGGAPRGEFEALHSLAGVLGGVRVVVPAMRLRAELERAKAALTGLAIDDLAISLWTRSILSLQWPPPDRRETALVKTWGGSIPFIASSAVTLDDVFGHLLDGFLRITDGASESDTVEVIDL